MKTEANYIIHPISETECRVAKYKNNVYLDTYIVNKLNNKWECSCISGVIRHYCKHKDWIHDIINGNSLPDNVSIIKEFNDAEVEKLMAEGVLV